jgi:hypothetical protein
MRTHSILAITTLIAAMLACITPLDEPAPNVKILGVKVNPPSGSGSFNLEVEFSARYSRDIPATIYCNYVTPDGKTMPVQSFTPQAGETIRSLPFSVAQRNGVIQPGTYLAGCITNNSDSSPVTTTFKVKDDTASTPTPENPSAPKATPTVNPQPQAAALKGQIVFDFAKAQSSRAGAGGETSRVTNLCIPDITITADGSLSGACEKLHIQALLVDESITAQVNGTMDASGNVAFSYDVSEIGNPNGAWRISYKGQGKFSSATLASGIASFSYSCSSGADNLLWCSSQTYEAFSGTVPWSFVPSQ